MRILIDTNVILDIALGRKPFAEHAAMLFKTAHQQKIHMYMTATTVTDLYYITRKEKGKETALSFIGDLMRFLDVVSVDKNVILKALRSKLPDFEDAEQVCSANHEGIKTIIGAVLVLMMVFRPGGIISNVRRNYKFERTAGE